MRVFRAFSTQEPRHTNNLRVTKSAKHRTLRHTPRKMLERPNALSFKRAAKSFRVAAQRLQPNLAIRGALGASQTPYLNLRGVHVRFVTEILN